MKENDVIDWLLKSSPWVEYQTRIDLLEQPGDAIEVIRARQAMLEYPRVKSIISELAEWPGYPLKRHNDAGHMIHKLVFLADIGVRADDPGVGKIIERIVDHSSPEGAFEIIMSISPHYGGSGKDEWVWMLCDTPSVLYSLLQMGADIPHVKEAAEHLVGYGQSNGWPCAVTPELGKFRGPGKKGDTCPYATLISLKALSLLPERRNSNVCRSGVETLLGLWEHRKERRPYLFAMGTDFRKLKAPFIWYDILHVLDVLTRFPFILEDERLLEMLDIVREKVDTEQLFAAESVWKAWSEWDFGQKKVASPWIILLVYRILKRAGIVLESMR
jgi:hypothetical protein